MQYWGPLGWRNNIPICQGGQCKCALQTTASCTAALHFTGLSCSNLTPRSSSFIPGTISWTVPRFYIILEKNSPLPEKTLQTVIPNTGCFFFTGPTPKSSKYKIMLEYLDWSRPSLPFPWQSSCT